MKTHFPGQFPQSKSSIHKLWNSCTFVVDANILLNLYRYSDSTRSQFLHVLDSISERLWLPHRAAEEYFANRLSVIGQQEKAYDDTVHTIEALERNLENARQHPFVAGTTLTRVKAVFDKLKQELSENQKIHTKRITQDPIRTSIAKVFSGRVGAEYDPKRLADILTEGETRYKERVPPGFKDENKGDDSERLANRCRKYGDLLVWFQILDRAQEQGTSMILVTDDKKDDWWEIFKGRTIGPRPELVKEFQSKTQQSFHMYQADQFLEFANEHLEQTIDESTLSEIREMQQRDIEMRVAQRQRRERDMARRVEYDALSDRVNSLRERSSSLAKHRDELMHHQRILQESISTELGDTERAEILASQFPEIRELEAERYRIEDELREIENTRTHFAHDLQMHHKSIEQVHPELQNRPRKRDRF